MFVYVIMRYVSAISDVHNDMFPIRNVFPDDVRLPMEVGPMYVQFDVDSDWGNSNGNGLRICDCDWRWQGQIHMNDLFKLTRPGSFLYPLTHLNSKYAYTLETLF